jgi:hypothetical protein
MPRTIEAASFPPAQRNSWYVVRSAIDGATPESVHVICKDPPPTNDLPATGLENLTSAKAVERRAARRGKGESRIVRERRARGAESRNRNERYSCDAVSSIYREGRCSCQSERAWSRSCTLDGIEWLREAL